MYNPISSFDRKKLLSLISLLIIIIAIPIGVYLAQKAQIFKPKASSVSCRSDNNLPVENQCLDGVKVLVYEYAQGEQCKLFYEPATGSCDSISPTTTPSTSPTVTPSASSGYDFDVNGDGKINLSDLSLLLSNLGKTSQNVGKSDINKDGRVNSLDRSLLIQELRRLKIIK